MVGTIETWGPLFRISFDLTFNSKPTTEHDYNILAFKGNGATNDCCNIGDRVPYFVFYPDETPERLHFASAVGANGNYYHDLSRYTIDYTPQIKGNRRKDYDQTKQTKHT